MKDKQMGQCTNATVQYSTYIVRYKTVQYVIVQYNSTQFLLLSSTTQRQRLRQNGKQSSVNDKLYTTLLLIFYAALHYSLDCTALHHTARQHLYTTLYTTLHCTAPHYTILLSTFRNTTLHYTIEQNRINTLTDNAKQNKIKQNKQNCLEQNRTKQNRVEERK